MNKITNKLTKEDKVKLLNQMILDIKNSFWVYNYIFLAKLIFQVPAPINRILLVKIYNFNWANWKGKKQTAKMGIEGRLFDVEDSLMEELDIVYVKGRQGEEYLFDKPFKFKKYLKKFPEENELRLRKRFESRVIQLIQKKINQASQTLWNRNTRIREVQI